MKTTTLLAAVALAIGLAVPVVPALAQGTSMPAPVTVGALQISGGFSRATLPNAPVAGGFLTIVNTGTDDDTLVSAVSPVSGMTQLHEMKMDGDVMKMSEVAGGIVVPAGQTVTLQPGGLHIMFMKLAGPLVEGTTVPVTLTFARAGTVEVELAVLDYAASSPAGAGAMGAMGSMAPGAGAGQ